MNFVDHPGNPNFGNLLDAAISDRQPADITCGDC
jgi:hypothetical protein